MGMGGAARSSRSCVYLAVAVALAAWALHFLTAPRFTVHDPATSAVLVTGASSGLGKDAALELDRLGFTVFAGYRKEADAEALSAAGSPRLVPTRVDVANAEQVDASVGFVRAECERRGVRLVGLVNNAGIAIPKPIALITSKEAERQYGVNVVGLLRATTAFLPTLTNNHGRVVNIGSLGALYSPPNHGLYTGTKAAVEAITDALRRETAILFPGQLSVSLLETGAITTPITGKLVAYLQEDSKRGLAACGTSEAGSSGGDSGPDSAACRYGMLSTAFNQLAEESIHGVPAENTAAVVHALTSPTPSARYLVGLDANILGRVVHVMPDRLLDWITRVVYSRKIDAIRQQM